MPERYPKTNPFKTRYGTRKSLPQKQVYRIQQQQQQKAATLKGVAALMGKNR